MKTKNFKYIEIKRNEKYTTGKYFTFFVRSIFKYLWLVLRIMGFGRYFGAIKRYINKSRAALNLYLFRASKSLKVYSLSDFADLKSCPSRIIFPSRSVRGEFWIVSQNYKKADLLTRELEYVCPSLRLVELRDATVFGCSNIIFNRGVAIFHDLYNLKLDGTSEELHGFMYLSPDQSRLSISSYEKPTVKIDQAATFLDACSSNYAHWLTEVLPRIAAFCSLPEHRSVPLLVDAGLPANMLRSLETVADDGRAIYLVPRWVPVPVRLLYVISATGYVPFSVRTVSGADNSHGIFSPDSLSLVTKSAVDAGIQANSQSPRLLYVKRNSDYRNIKNATELERLIESFGFTTVEPEKLSFWEQVSLFSNADIVIGPTGAAMANVLFCKPGTKCCIFMSDAENMIFGYWPRMFAPLGIQVAYIVGAAVGGTKSNLHSDYLVCIKTLRKYLEMI